jgi:ribosomal protein L37AE/L43A
MIEIDEQLARGMGYEECPWCFDSEKTPHCPDCDSAEVTTRHGGMTQEPRNQLWYCYKCKAEFDEPSMSHGVATIRGDTLAGDLQDMDPDTEIYNPEKESEADE